MVEVGLVDDVPEMRALVRLCIEAMPDLKLAWEAASVAQARREMARRKPTWVLLDEVMPLETGLDFVPELFQAGVGVILLTGEPRAGEAHARGRPIPSGVAARLVKPDWDQLRREPQGFAQTLRNVIFP